MKKLFIFIILIISSIMLQAQYKGEYLGRAIECSEKKDVDCVIENLNKAIPLEKNKKNLSFYYTQLSVAYQIKFEIDKALTSLNNALDLNKKNAQAYFLRGIVHNKLFKYEKSIDDFSKFLKYAEKQNIQKLEEKIDFAKDKIEKMQSKN